MAEEFDLSALDSIQKNPAGDFDLSALEGKDKEEFDLSALKTLQPSKVDQNILEGEQVNKGVSWANEFHRKLLGHEKDPTGGYSFLPMMPFPNEMWAALQKQYPMVSKDPEARKAAWADWGKYSQNVEKMQKTIKEKVKNWDSLEDIKADMGEIWTVSQAPMVKIAKTALGAPVTPWGTPNPFAIWGFIFGVAEEKGKTDPTMRGLLDGMTRIQQTGLSLVKNLHDKSMERRTNALGGLPQKPVFEDLADIYSDSIIKVDPLINAKDVMKGVTGKEPEEDLVSYAGMMALDIATHPATYLLAAMHGKLSPGRGKVKDLKEEMDIWEGEKKVEPSKPSGQERLKVVEEEIKDIEATESRPSKPMPKGPVKEFPPDDGPRITGELILTDEIKQTLKEKGIDVTEVEKESLPISPEKGTHQKVLKPDAFEKDSSPFSAESDIERAKRIKDEGEYKNRLEMSKRGYINAIQTAEKDLTQKFGKETAKEVLKDWEIHRMNAGWDNPYPEALFRNFVEEAITKRTPSVVKPTSKLPPSSVVRVVDGEVEIKGVENSINKTLSDIGYEKLISEIESYSTKKVPYMNEHLLTRTRDYLAGLISEGENLGLWKDTTAKGMEVKARLIELHEWVTKDLAGRLGEKEHIVRTSYYGQRASPDVEIPKMTIDDLSQGHRFIKAIVDILPPFMRKAFLEKGWGYQKTPKEFPAGYFAPDEGTINISKGAERDPSSSSNYLNQMFPVSVEIHEMMHQLQSVLHFTEMPEFMKRVVKDFRDPEGLNIQGDIVEHFQKLADALYGRAGIKGPKVTPGELVTDVLSGFFASPELMRVNFPKAYSWLSLTVKKNGENIKSMMNMQKEIENVGHRKRNGNANPTKGLSIEELTDLSKRGRKVVDIANEMGTLVFGESEYYSTIFNAGLKEINRALQVEKLNAELTKLFPSETARELEGIELPSEANKRAEKQPSKLQEILNGWKDDVDNKRGISVKIPGLIYKLISIIDPKLKDRKALAYYIKTFKNVASQIEETLKERGDLKEGELINKEIRTAIYEGNRKLGAFKDMQIKEMIKRIEENPTLSLKDLMKEKPLEMAYSVIGEYSDSLRKDDTSLGTEIVEAGKRLLADPKGEGTKNILSFFAGKLVPSTLKDGMGIVKAFVDRFGKPHVKRAHEIMQGFTGSATTVEYLLHGDVIKVGKRVAEFAKGITTEEEMALLSFRSLMDSKIALPSEAGTYFKNDPRLMSLNQKLEGLLDEFFLGASDTHTSLGRKALKNLMETYLTRYPRMGDSVVEMIGSKGRWKIDSPTADNPIAKIKTDASVEMFYNDLTGKKLPDIDKEPASLKLAVDTINLALTTMKRAKDPLAPEVKMTAEQIRDYYSLRELMLYQAKRQGERGPKFTKTKVAFTPDKINTMRLELNEVIRGKMENYTTSTGSKPLAFDNIIKEAELRKFISNELRREVPFTKLSVTEIKRVENARIAATRAFKKVLRTSNIIDRIPSMEQILHNNFRKSYKDVRGKTKEISDLVFEVVPTKRLTEFERVAPFIKTPTEMKARSNRLWRTRYPKDLADWLTVHLQDLVKYKHDLVLEEYRKNATREIANIKTPDGRNGVSEFKTLIRAINDMYAYQTSGSSVFQIPLGKTGEMIDRFATWTSKGFGWAKVSMSPSTHLIQPLQMGYTGVVYGLRNTILGLGDMVNQLGEIASKKPLTSPELKLAERIGLLEGQADLTQGTVTEMVQSLKMGKGGKRIGRQMDEFLLKTFGDQGYKIAKLPFKAVSILHDILWNKPTQLYKWSDMLWRLATLNAWKRTFPEHFRLAVKAVDFLATEKESYGRLREEMLNDPGVKGFVSPMDAIRRAVDGVNAAQVNYARSGQSRFWYNPTWNALTGLFKKYDIRMTVDEVRRASDMLNFRKENGKIKIGSAFGPDNLIVAKQFFGSFLYQSVVGGVRAARIVGLAKLGLIGLGLGWQFLGTIFKSQEKIEEGGDLALMIDKWENEINGWLSKNPEDPASKLLSVAYEGVFDTFLNISVSDRMAVRADVSPLGNVLLHGENLARAVGGEGQAAYESERQKIKDIIMPSMAQGILQGAVMMRMNLDQLERVLKEKGQKLSPEEKKLQEYLDRKLDHLGVQGMSIVRDMPNIRQEDVTMTEAMVRMTVGFSSPKLRKEALTKKLVKREETTEEAKLAHAVTIETAKVRGIRGEKERREEMIRWAKEMRKNYRVTPQRIMGRLTNVEDRDMSFIKTLKSKYSTPEVLKKTLTTYAESGELRDYMLRQAEENTRESYQRYRFVSTLCRRPEMIPNTYNDIYAPVDDGKIIQFLKKWRG